MSDPKLKNLIVDKDISQLREVGFVLSPHSLKGEMKLKTFDKNTQDWFLDLKQIFFKKVNEIYSLNVEQIRVQKPNLFIVKCKDIRFRDQSEFFKGSTLLVETSFFANSSDESAGDGEYFLNQLEGFSVFHLDGESLVGFVDSFKETGAHDILVLKAPKGFFEIPYVDAFIKEVNFDSKKIVMNFPISLLDDDYKV